MPANFTDPSFQHFLHIPKNHQNYNSCSRDRPQWQAIFLVLSCQLALAILATGFSAPRTPHCIKLLEARTPRLIKTSTFRFDRKSLRAYVYLVATLLKSFMPNHEGSYYQLQARGQED
jgi:hypothetical protein